MQIWTTGRRMGTTYGAAEVIICILDHIRHMLHFVYTHLAFWLGRLAFVSDVVSKPMADSSSKRPSTSVGPPSGGRAAFLSPMHPLNSTRPHGLVQAIFWHTCPDLDLGPWYCLTHWTHIVLSGSMTSVPYSQWTLCAKWTCNVHYYRTYKEQESQKHVTTSCSGTKPFY